MPVPPIEQITDNMFSFFTVHQQQSRPLAHGCVARCLDGMSVGGIHCGQYSVHVLVDIVGGSELYLLCHWCGYHGVWLDVDWLFIGYF